MCPHQATRFDPRPECACRFHITFTLVLHNSTLVNQSVHKHESNSAKMSIFFEFIGKMLMLRENNNDQYDGHENTCIW